MWQFENIIFYNIHKRLCVSARTVSTYPPNDSYDWTTVRKPKHKVKLRGQNPLVIVPLSPVTIARRLVKTKPVLPPSPSCSSRLFIFIRFIMSHKGEPAKQLVIFSWICAPFLGQRGKLTRRLPPEGSDTSEAFCNGNSQSVSRIHKSWPKPDCFWGSSRREPV